MKTILATTYAVNPFKGSEDGMGWNFVCQIARNNKVIAITRENNQTHIEKYMLENPSDVYQNIQFLYFDLPYWMRFWKKGGRGAMLYYWMWQKGIVAFIKKQNLSFDIVHNVNFHNDWTPSYLWKLNKPFIWGPIGHHPEIPKQYLAPFKKSYFIKDKLTWWIKHYFWNFSFSLKKTVKKADYVLCMNSSVADILKLEKDKYEVIPSVATEDFGFEKQIKNDSFTLISAGRLVPLKGFDLSILAFGKFVQRLPESEKSKAKLIIVGNGPEKELLKQMCRDNSIDNNIEFIKWIDRVDLLEIYKKSTAFLFPSHEGAGMVVAEALSFGLPVICLDNCGPGEFISEKSGIAVKMGDYSSTVNGLSEAIFKIYSNKEFVQKMSDEARIHFEQNFKWDRRGDQLKDIYSNF
jgi:glycosyltransferase involved in cell wall biosynthesis